MKLSSSGTKCEEECVVGLVSAVDWIRYGLKPYPAAIIHMLTQDTEYNPFRTVLKQSSEPLRVGVAGDTFNDLKLGYYLETALNNGQFGSKVRGNKTSGKIGAKVKVDKILVNRYRNGSELADRIVPDVRGLANLIKSESYDLFICDGDNTLWKYYLTKNITVKDKSLFDKYGSLFPVRASYTLFTITDMFWSFLKVHNRKLFCKSDGCVEDVLNAAKRVGSKLIINSMSNPINMLKVLGEVNSIKKCYYYNNYFA